MNGAKDLRQITLFLVSLVPFLQIINLPLLPWMCEELLVVWEGQGLGTQGFSAPCTDFQTLPLLSLATSQAPAVILGISNG